MCIRDSPRCGTIHSRSLAQQVRLLHINLVVSQLRQMKVILVTLRTFFRYNTPGDNLLTLIDVDETEHDVYILSLIHISEPTRLLSISYAVFCLKKKKKKIQSTMYQSVSYTHLRPHETPYTND